MDWKEVLTRVDDSRWELPVSAKPGMRVPGMIYADDALLEEIREDQCIDQVANVAFLPGIVGHSMAMPDVHWGYGFPIGGVAATAVDEGGVVSPGGVGFDINCGIRLLRTDLVESEVRPRLRELVSALFSEIHTGTGQGSRIRISVQEVDQVLARGAAWAVDKGFGDPNDLSVTEENGRMDGADPSVVGERPKKRGAPQLGTLGSGNHFLELQAVDRIVDAEAARAMGIVEEGQVTVMIHCGSRGLGHQVCTDYVRTIDGAQDKYGIEVPDRQLACVPVSSSEGSDYLAAMQAAANFAWANRQCIAALARGCFEGVFERSWESLGIRQVYDVSHNMAKLEEHPVSGRMTRLCVHRKGATRSFPAGHPDIPEVYRDVGQPVMIPGDMGRYSYLCAGMEGGMTETFGSTCHGAGRRESRSRAKKLLKGRDIQGELEEQGIIAMAHGWASLAEEASMAYKDVEAVVAVAEAAGLSKRVARLRPLGVIKG